jgi:hypothetical protein
MSAIASYSIMHAKGLKKILKQRGVAKDIIAGCAERIDLVELCIETHPDDSDTGDDEDDCSANSGDRGGGGGDVDKGDVNNNSNNGASDQANITTSSDSSTAPLSSSAASASLSSSSTPTTTNDFASLSMKELKKLLKKRGVTPGSACIDKADLVALATKTMSVNSAPRVLFVTPSRVCASPCAIAQHHKLQQRPARVLLCRSCCSSPCASASTKMHLRPA